MGMVIAVGPINDDIGLYEWAVISDSWGLAMFIVARDPDRFATTYEEIVLKLVKEKGFDTVISKPIASYQGSNCIYRDEGAEVPEEPRSPLPVQPSPVRPSPVKPEARWAIPLYPSPVSPSKPNHVGER